MKVKHVDEIETKFLEGIKSLEKLTPNDVLVVEDNDHKDKKLVVYLVNVNGEVFGVGTKKNGNSILTIHHKERVFKVSKNSEYLYLELKQKARNWYRDADLNKYTVMFNNTECKVHLDLFSWIPPFVLKPIHNKDERYIGLDFLTVFNLINE